MKNVAGDLTETTKKRFRPARGMAAGIAVCALTAALSGCVLSASSVFAADKKKSRDVFAMDTYMTLTAYGDHADEAIDGAVEEIHRLDALLTTGSGTSEVGQINEAQQNSYLLSEDTASLMESSLLLYEATDGAFDLTVYPLMKLWGFTDGNFRVPSQEEIDAALGVVGADAIEYDASSGRVTFDKNGMEIDFGGIAKGYTSDRLMELFREHGVESAIVSLGGNVQALGKKPDGSPWKVGIQTPEEDGRYLGIVEIEDQAVITSGGYERFFEEDGRTYHHILDPETGYPAESGLLSVTIVSPDGTLADGLSTSLFVMGEEKAVDFWKVHGEAFGFEFVLLTDEGRLLASDGLRDALTSDYAKIEWVEG